VKATNSEAGVYVTLDQLAALRHRACGFSFLPHQPVKSLLAGGHSSKLRGRGLDFDEIRRYQPGDDPRTIDWKVTARMRKPYSRVFTEERERPVLLLVDQRINMFFGSVHSMKSVVAAEATALAAWRTIAVKDRVGAIVFNDSELVEIRPQRTQSNVLRLLQTVVQQNRALKTGSSITSNPAMFDEALRRASRLATHDFLIIIISDGYGSSPRSKEILTNIAHHNDVLMAFVFDPLESQLPDASHLVVANGERQMEINPRKESLREGFRQQFEEQRAVGKHFLLTRDIPVLPLQTDVDVHDQISRALGAGAGGRRGQRR
jgi:uncharacterized protein (DUF58 family)